MRTRNVFLAAALALGATASVFALAQPRTANAPVVAAPSARRALVFVLTTGVEDLQSMNAVFRHAKLAAEQHELQEVVVLVYGNALDHMGVPIRWETGADIAVSNGFRFAHPIAPGPITEGDLGRLYPVNGPLKIGHVTGRQLRAFWESELEHVFATDPARLFGGWLPRVAGMRVTFRAHAPAGRRVERLEIGGAPVDDDARYTIASCAREGDAPDTARVFSQYFLR